MLRFLIVDNSAVVRHTLMTEISKVDRLAQFREADREGPAIQADAEWRPDVVFLGLLLAGQESGLAVLRSLLGRRPERPVVLCTGLPADHPDVVQATSMGAFAWIPKPVSPLLVRRTVNQIHAYRGNYRSIT